MMACTVFHSASGARAWRLEVPDEAQMRANESPEYIVVVGEISDDFYYDLDNSGVAPKRLLDVYHSASVALGEVLVISIPEYFGVLVKGPSGATVPLIDNEVHFSTVEPGEYRFIFSGVEIYDREVVINAA